MVLWWQWILGQARKYVSYGFEICSDKTFYFGQNISVTQFASSFEFWSMSESSPS